MATGDLRQEGTRSIAAVRRAGIGATFDYVVRNYWLYVFLLPGLANDRKTYRRA